MQSSFEVIDALAGQWDDERPDCRTMTDRMVAHAGLLAFRSGDDLLDVGCGTGKTTAWLARQVAPGRVTAVDFSPRMIDRAVAKDIAADFRCLDVCGDDLGVARFDVVLCFHCFPHFRDQRAALRILSRSLKPDGRLIVMHLAGSGQINAFHSGIDGVVSADVLPAGDQWGDLLQQADLFLFMSLSIQSNKVA